LLKELEDGRTFFYILGAVHSEEVVVRVVSVAIYLHLIHTDISYRVTNPPAVPRDGQPSMLVLGPDQPERPSEAHMVIYGTDLGIPNGAQGSPPSKCQPGKIDRRSLVLPI